MGEIQLKDDRLISAIEQVNMDLYVYQPNGQLIQQTTDPALIHSMLEVLEVREGDSVLEIGTGSGYSTALLSALVGHRGRVVTMDIESHLIERADRLFSEQSISNVQAVLADGRGGYTGEEQFDRIVAWCTADHIPFVWCNQAAQDGIMVVPVKVLPLEGSTVVIKARMVQNQVLQGERVTIGSFVPMSKEPLPLKPIADAIIEKKGTPVVWGSTEWSRQSESSKLRFSHLLEQISVDEHRILRSSENPWDFRSYLLAKRPHGLTIIGSPALRMALGYSDRQGVSVLSLNGTHCAQAGSEYARTILNEWVEQWRSDGNPGMDRLKPTFERDSNGWKVSVEIY